MAKQAAPALGELDLNSSPTHLLHRLGQCATDLFQGELGAVDLTPRQFLRFAEGRLPHRYASALQRYRPGEAVVKLDLADLVDMTGIDRSTLADIVRRMLKKGLVQRRRTKDDARAYAVKLTDQGRKTLKLAEPLVRSVDSQILGALSAAEQNKFMSNLHAMIDNLSGEDEADGANSAEGAKSKGRSRGRAGSSRKSPARKS